MKLKIAIPTVDYIHFEFANCLTALVRKLDKDGVDFDVQFKGNTLVYEGRDVLAMEAICNKYTHILWLDADMIFEPDVFEKLYAHGKPLVSGAYNARRPPHSPCMFPSLDPLEKLTEYPQKLFEIKGCGFGCCLTETRMFATVYKEFGTCFQPTYQFGEDLAFCQRASEQGYKLYCDPNVKAGHIGHITIWPEGGQK